MTLTLIGILHPGDMGISIAASAKNGGHTVYWASDGRGAHTRARAEKHGLQDARHPGRAVRGLQCGDQRVSAGLPEQHARRVRSFGCVSG